MQKFKTYLIGGSVRDELLGLKPKDLDFVMVCPSFLAMKEQLLSEGAKIFVEKPEFLVIRCNHPRLGAVDFACARGDGVYTDGRHPDSVKVATTIEEDISRRDFSCNAIAKDIDTGEMIDPHDGLKDIQKKLVRCVGNPVDRFNEDKLRVFRAVRFAVTKDFTIASDTENAIHEIQDFSGTSTERIREELDKMFRADTDKSLKLLLDFPNLWRVIGERNIWLKPTVEKA